MGKPSAERPPDDPGDIICRALDNFREKHGTLEVILEPGSAIAWETGDLVSTVLDITDNRNIKTAIVDVSFTAHMPDTLEMPYRPRIVGATDPQPDKPCLPHRGVSCLVSDYGYILSIKNLQR